MSGKKSNLALSKRVRSFTRRHKLSIREFARSAAVSEKTIRNLLSPERRILVSEKAVRKISEALTANQRTMEYLLTKAVQRCRLLGFRNRQIAAVMALIAHNVHLLGDGNVPQNSAGLDASNTPS